MSVPGELDLTIQQGDSFTMNLRLRTKLPDGTTIPVDLTNHVGRAQMRRSVRDDTVMANFTVEVTDPTGGELKVSLTPAESRAIDRDGVWDLETESPAGVVRTWVQGNVDLRKEVTRA